MILFPRRDFIIPLCWCIFKAAGNLSSAPLDFAKHDHYRHSLVANLHSLSRFTVSVHSENYAFRFPKTVILLRKETSICAGWKNTANRWDAHRTDHCLSSSPHSERRSRLSSSPTLLHTLIVVPLILFCCLLKTLMANTSADRDDVSAFYSSRACQCEGKADVYCWKCWYLKTPSFEYHMPIQR